MIPSEELYQGFPGLSVAENTCIAEYPTFNDTREFKYAEKSINATKKIFLAIQAVKYEYRLNSNSRPKVTVIVADPKTALLILKPYIETFAPAGKFS